MFDCPLFTQWPFFSFSLSHSRFHNPSFSLLFFFISSCSCEFMVYIFFFHFNIKIEFSWVNIDFVSMIRMYLFGNMKR